MRLSAQSGEGLGVVGVDGRRSVGSGATSVVASLATETTSLSSASTGSLTRSLTTLSVSSGRSGRLGELTVNLDVNLLLLGLALGLGVLRLMQPSVCVKVLDKNKTDLAGEEVINGLPDESLTLNLGGNFSSLLLAESGDGSVLLSTLGKILLVRLGRFLGLLLSLGLSGGSLGLSHDTLSRSLRSVLLNLCVLLTLNLV